jgi:hypothetical protein
MESTSAETLELLSDIDLDSTLRNDISQLLIDSDLIKFAKVIPELNEHKVMISQSFDIVNKCDEQMIEKEGEVNV